MSIEDFELMDFKAGDNLDLSGTNSTHPFIDSEYIFDRPDVRAVFLTLYTVVFCSCFFGNLMVILVVSLRMRSITNFCLANLAFADLCVGIFCVYQNIIQYIMDSWPFGEFMCKMYHFISSLSTTASILILVVICIERYLAIIHPMKCKQILTLGRLRCTIVGVWVVSAVISSPRLYYFSTIVSPYSTKVEYLCIPNQLKYNSKLVDMASLVLLFIIPLLVISILYFRIGVVLWKSSSGNMPQASNSVESSSSSRYESNVGQNSNQSQSASPSYTHFRPRQRKTIFILKCPFTTPNNKNKRRRQRKNNLLGTNRLSHQSSSLPPCNEVCRCVGSVGTVIGVAHSNNNETSSVQRSTSAMHLENAALSIVPHQCTITPSGRGHAVNTSESVSISPCLKRNLSVSTSNRPISTEPIVVVTFEKKGSLKNRKSNCTIMLRPAISAGNLGSESSCSRGTKGALLRAPHNNPTIDVLPEECGGESRTNITSIPTLVGHNRKMSSWGKKGPTQHPKMYHGEGRCDKNLELDPTYHHCPKDILPHHPLESPPQGSQSSCHHSHTALLRTEDNQNIPNNCKGASATSSRTRGLKRTRVIRSSKYGARALQCRRRIIKMLIIIVVIFAACHLPFHARKIWQFWGKYDPTSFFSEVFTPITFLILYAQSGINPVLYAFMSRKFRNSFADLLCCKMRSARNFSVRSTTPVQLSQVS